MIQAAPWEKASRLTPRATSTPRRPRCGACSSTLSNSRTDEDRDCLQQARPHAQARGAGPNDPGLRQETLQLRRDVCMAHKLTVLTILSAAAVALALAPAASAQSVEQFFARKTITISIGYTAGGSYDLYGRLVARHLGKHIPGQPTVVAQNMPGAGSLKAANYIYDVAPKDGTALGVVVESAALEQALANPAALYDSAKFTWIGRVATSNNIFMQWHTSKVQSIEDSMRLESSLAGTGPGSIAETVPRLLNAHAGTKVKP